MGVAKLLRPDLVLEHVTDLTPELAEELGVRGLLIDIDCTLMPHGGWSVPEEVRRWLRALADAGVRLHLVTNARRKRSQHIAASLELPCVARAAKPFPWRTRRALEALALAPDEVAIVGDQLFADVMVGKLLGLKAILVKPYPGRQAISTWLKRPFEWIVLWWFGDQLKTGTASTPSGTCQSQKTSARTCPQNERQPAQESDPPGPPPSTPH